MAATATATTITTNNIPARGATITTTITLPLTYESTTITGVVAGFNYSFDRITAVFVDTATRGQVVVWL